MKSTIKVGDFSVCKEAANQFYITAQRCKGENFAEYLLDGFYPYAVNVAFSCELYLKAIMIHRSPSNEFFTGHELSELFSHLDPTDSRVIERNFAGIMKSKDLHTFLINNNKVFEEWRYALEGSVTLDISGFEAFSEILHDYVQPLV